MTLAAIEVRQYPLSMRRLRFALAWVAILVAGLGCAGRSTPGSASTVNQNTIMPDEFNQRSFYSAYEAVEALRPSWLNRRGPDGAIQVYVDDNHLGGLEVLRTIRLPSVAVIRHMDGIQAGARYGLGHDQGVILITTRAAAR
jgi:hypothetical protein